VPFARLSLSDGAAAVKQQASVGVVFQNVSQRNDDVIGIAASWMDPADPAFRDETTLEAFWRIHLTPEIAITPSIQYIRNPAKTTAYDSTTVASLRVRFLF
jgi:porin